MTISQELKQYNIITGDKIAEIFDELYADILTVPLGAPSQFIGDMWSRYTNTTPSLNGALFEGLISAVLFRLNISPIYLQAKLAFVPNVDFDFILYSREYGPIVLSSKTSLRERYKQADLEGMMVRQVHRRAKNYLLTLDEREARGVKEKIGDGKVLGLDDVIVATEPEFDNLIDFLNSLEFYKPEKIEIITGSRVIENH